MALLDHLVPAFSGEAYGDRGLLDDLPVSNIRPMVFVSRDGRRRVEHRTLSTTKDGQAVLFKAGWVHPAHRNLLPKIQYQDFAVTAAVDPKLDLSTEELDFKMSTSEMLFWVVIFALGYVIVPGVFIGGIYGLVKIANRATPKGKV